MKRAELRDALAERWPDGDADALAWSVQYLEPLVHPPPTGTWGRYGATSVTLADTWLGQPMPAGASPDELVRRYLAAFGPASVMDIQAWSGLTRLGEVVERLRPQLRTFYDDAGRELFDLPEAPRLDPDTPAPARLLPAVDNLMVAYADRTRLMTAEQRRVVCVGAVVAPTVLVDGTVCAMWKIAREHDDAILHVELLGHLSNRDRDAVTEEGARLLAFAAGEAATHDIRYTPPG